MAYSGYLIKLKGGSQTETLPFKFMAIASYKCTPDQRLESKAARNVDGVLYRSTVSHKPTKIEFNTPPISNVELVELNSMLQSHFSNALERKIVINYYDMETDSYRDATCYMPDVDYTIDRIDNKNNIVYYQSVRYAFIEY